MNVYVGSSGEYQSLGVEAVMEHAIHRHATKPVAVNFMRPGRWGLTEHGCTGFTNFRWAVPMIHAQRAEPIGPSLAERFAVYLDVDMLLRADIHELLEWARPGEWSCLKSGDTEVMVIDLLRPVAAATKCHEEHKSKWQKLADPQPRIPNEWNHEDELRPDTKLLHFTNIALQPWRPRGRKEHPERWVYDEERERERNARRDSGHG